MSSSPTFDAFFGTATSNPGETRAPYDYQRRLANELQRERFIAALTGSPNPQVYWRVMKKRLRAEGNQTVTNCHALKMTAADGRQRLTDVADTEQLLRLIQSIPSPKAEPFKLWLARVGFERLEEIENPELAASRMISCFSLQMARR